MTPRDPFGNGTGSPSTQLDCWQLLLDPITRGEIGKLDLRPGSRCWELGAGGGTIALHLSGVVGERGLVVATDKDTSQLNHLGQLSNVVVDRSNVGAFGVPRGGPFDLVTARLLLSGLAERVEVMRTAVGAVKPGGWVLLGECDYTEAPRVITAPDDASADLFRRVTAAVLDVFAGRGVNLAWARRVEPVLRDLGLTDVHAVADRRERVGGSPGCLLHEVDSILLQPELEDSGISPEDLDRFRRLMHDPRFGVMSYPFVYVRGRKPTPDDHSD